MAEENKNTELASESTAAESAIQETTDTGVIQAPQPDLPQSLESLVAAKLKPLKFSDILSIPFNDVPYDADFFEQALIRLYARGSNIFVVFLFHFFILGPVMSLPYLRPIKKITTLNLIVRFLISLIIPFITYFTIYYTLYEFDYEYLFPAIMGLVTGAFIVAYTFMSLHDFRPWSAAYVRLRPLLKNYKRPRQVKKIKKPVEPANETSNETNVKTSV